MLVLLESFVENKINEYLLLANDFSLGHKEKKTLQMMLDQPDRATISKSLNIMNKTISSHIVNIKRKLDTKSNVHMFFVFLLKSHIDGYPKLRYDTAVSNRTSSKQRWPQSSIWMSSQVQTRQGRG